MDNYLHPRIEDELREIPAQTLAHIGDAVYELMVRTYVCANGTWAVSKLHKKSVEFVSAKAQASYSALLLPLLSDEEAEIYKRGRNAHTAVPTSATPGEYRAATGLETLFGYLYLSGNIKRLNELFYAVIKGKA